MNITHDSINQFCAELGKDSLLVQGAGGNVSWKEGDTLWIKGSGTWLANAKDTNIFVPVNLIKLNASLSRGDFSVVPELKTTSHLSPSIETILHALMPQKVVIHLHAINPLARLVLHDANVQIARISEKLVWESVFIEYFKPGPDLARAIDAALKLRDEVNILFLKNHGVVVGGKSTAEVQAILNDLLDAFSGTPTSGLKNFSSWMPKVPTLAKEFYQAFEDINVQQLAQNPTLFSYLHSSWALYPDHVVFLGSKAFAYKSWEDFFDRHPVDQIFPELVFIEDEGVFVIHDFNLAKTAQLRCYFDVVSRIPGGSMLDSLNGSDVTALMNWDAEKLRQKISV